MDTALVFDAARLSMPAIGAALVVLALATLAALAAIVTLAWTADLADGPLPRPRALPVPATERLPRTRPTVPAWRRARVPMTTAVGRSARLGA